MVTVVNTPQGTNNDSGTNWVVGVVLVILLILIVLFLGGPLLRRVGVDSGVQTPSQIDVNVEGGEQSAGGDNNEPPLPDLNINQEQDSDNTTETEAVVPTSTPDQTSTPASTDQ